MLSLINFKKIPPFLGLPVQLNITEHLRKMSVEDATQKTTFIEIKN